MPQPTTFQSDPRPEQCQRSGQTGHADEVPGWLETEPGCFRSEAFAEDLPAQDLGAPQAGAAGAAGMGDGDHRRTWRDGLGFMGLAVALLYGSRGG
jgi:hypothetical protein